MTNIESVIESWNLIGHLSMCDQYGEWFHLTLFDWSCIWIFQTSKCQLTLGTSHTKHIEAEATWTTLCWWYFWMHFCEWNLLYFDTNFIKSPRYTGGDFMFLYRFVRRRRRRRRRPRILVHAITFEQLFRFLSFLAPLLALTYRLTD